MQLAAADDDARSKLMMQAFDQLMRWLHAKQTFDASMLTDKAVQNFITQHATALNSAVDEVIQQRPLDDITVQRLKESNYVFSGFKTFHELNEAMPSLLTETGERKPFKQFLNDVQSINKNYNAWYLSAEYDFAMSAAQMAGKWQEFAKKGADYYLQYRTVGDKRVMPTHRNIDKVTLPMSSPFWDSYFPPNGWKCRCTAVQVRKSKYAASDEQQAMNDGSQATTGKHQEMMRFNPGKQMACFPAYNPYTITSCIGCDGNRTGNDLCAACKIIKTI